MVLVRYWQTAVIAAIMALAANAVWAQETKPGSSGTYISGLKSCSGSTCCKDGKCCKDGDCCRESKKCDAHAEIVKICGALYAVCSGTSKKCEASCTCCKDNKCECCKGECGCGKSGKCSCKDTECASCPFMNNVAKHTAVIMVMPASMPLPGCCPLEAVGMMPHPPMPPGPGLVGPDYHLNVMGIMPPPPMPPMPQVFMQPMPPHIAPPMPIPHPMPVNIQEAHTGNVIFGYGVNSNCGLCGSVAAPATPAVVSTCACCSSAVEAKIRIVPVAGNDGRLEMRVGEETSIRCKNMTIAVGENEICVSRFDDRVRIRGDELKATACGIRTDGKDRLILEGDVVLHYKKEGHAANVIGERIELNLNNSSMTIQKTGAIHIERHTSAVVK